MAATAENRSNVVKLVVMATGQAPGLTLLFDLEQEINAGKSLLDIANILTTSAGFLAEYPITMTAEEFSARFLDNIIPGIDAAARAVGITTISGLLNDGATQAAILLAATDFLSNTSPTDANFGVYAALFQNRVAVAEYHTVTLELDTVLDLSAVTADPASVVTTNATIEESIFTGEIFTLTTAPNNFVGSSADTMFTANLVEHFGQLVNTLGSDDSLSGEAGSDILNATVIPAAFLGTPIQPTTSSIEVVNIKAANSGIAGGNAIAYISAEDMLGVKTIGSWRSDASLVIRNMTTKGNDGEVGSMNDITIQMGYTGGKDSVFNESNLAVYFDLDYPGSDPDPITPANLGRPTVDIQLMNEDKYDVDYADGLRGNKIEALAGVYIDKMKITLNGVDYQLAPLIDESPGPGIAPSVDYIKTYPQLLTAVQDAIAQLKANNPSDVALQSLAAVLGGQFLAGISPTFGVGQRVGTSILLSIEDSSDGAVNQNGDPINSNSLAIESSKSLALDPISSTDIPNSNRYANSEVVEVVEADEAVEAVPSLDLLPINVKLENVGLAGDGGELIIGSIFKDGVNEWSDPYAGKGIGEFEVTVSGSSNMPSSLSGLHSTGNSLDEVTVQTNAAQTGTFASLTIGNSNTADITGAVGSTPSASNANALKDVQVFDASALKGDLKLFAALTNEVIAKYMTLVDDADDDTADNVQFTYTGGTGNDYINLHLNSANLAAAGTTTSEGFALTINGGDGDDEIATMIGDGSSNGFGYWYANSVINANLAVSVGAGNDTVRTLGAGNFVISAGAGDDTVYADNSGDRATYVFNVVDGDAGSAGNQFELTNLQSQTAATVSAVNAGLTVTFKGLSKTVDIANSAGALTNVAIDDLSVNQAIKSAINSDPVLGKLLLATDGPGRSLVVTSLIDGEDIDTTDLNIAFGTTGALSAAQSSAVPALTLFAATTALSDGYLTTNFAQSAPQFIFGIKEFNGSNSTSASDNVITGGTGNDVIVLGTTKGSTNAMSSNDIVKYEAGAFGNDTVVHYSANNPIANKHIDQFDFHGLGGDITTQVNLTTLVAKNKSIFVVAETTANDTAAEIKALLNASAVDNATVSTHVYVAYNEENVADVYTVVDGVASNDLKVTLVGTIDLADTPWSTLTVANFL